MFIKTDPFSKYIVNRHTLRKILVAYEFVVKLINLISVFKLVTTNGLSSHNTELLHNSYNAKWEIKYTKIKYSKRSIIKKLSTDKYFLKFMGGESILSYILDNSTMNTYRSSLYKNEYHMNIFEFNTYVFKLIKYEYVGKRNFRL